MAYTGTTTFAVTRTDIINRAAGKIGLLDSGETLSSNAIADMGTQLNIIVKRIMADGVGLWLRLTPTLFLQKGQESYQLGASSTDHWTISYNATTTTAAAAANATTITVASTTGIVNGYQIGITQTDGTKFWTTVSGSPSGSTVTLTAGLTVGCASGANVYCYQTTADRPQKILYCNRRYTADLTNIIDVPVDVRSQMDYMNLPQKGNQSQTVQVTYVPTIASATLYVWPTYDGVSGYDLLQFVTEGIMEDITGATDNPYFPIEWADFLIWQLAAEMSYEFGTEYAERDRLFAIADKFLQKLLDYDTSEAPIQFGMRIEGRRY